MEAPFEKVDGVVAVISGYEGGTKKNLTYEEVSSGTTGHLESVQVIFDTKKVSYEELLNIFWHQVDPTDERGQFVDRSYQYTTAIFYHDDEQKKLAEESKEKLDKSGKYYKPVTTPIRKAEEFYPAEDYHQDYYKNHSLKYSFYRSRSGRDQYLEKIWTTDLKEKLTPLQYKVTQEDGTEPAFNNEYWDNKREGIYVDIVSGEPLFSSKDKYDSGTGWPSFSKPLEKENIVEKEDNTLFITRTEVRRKQGNSHLGHVFNDGPLPTGKRYCMNSAALRFIPKEDLENNGYEEYKELFD